MALKKQIQLSDHFNYETLLRFTVPSIIMMLFTSLYSIVDGLFVSNYVGKTGFAAINLIMPALNILATFGYMFGAGGSALIAKTLGEGKREKANHLFSMFVWLSIVFGVVMMILGFLFMRPIAEMLGAEGQLLEDSVLYGRIFILALPAWILLYEFQLFFVTAEKPKLGLSVTVAAGVTNIVLDALFIIVFHWGLAGAALASAISQVVGGVFPLIYFGRKNTSLLKLVKPKFDGRALLWFIYGLIGVVTVGAIYTLRKYKAIRKWEMLDVVLTEIIIIDVVVFLAIQLFTGSNPNYIISSITIGIASTSVQLLFYRVMKPQWMKILPLVLMIGWLFWGILLELAKAVWANENVWNLIVYSALPAVCTLVTWSICRKRDVQKEKLIPNIKLFAIVFVVVLLVVGIFGQDMLAKIYVKAFHKHLENYAEELLEESENTTSDKYGFWKVTCYPEDGLVEFRTGGSGLVFNSTYEGFYYSADNTHKAFQGADVSLIVNKELSHWNGEGDNWGKSTRLIEKWFWYETHF